MAFHAAIVDAGLLLTNEETHLPSASRHFSVNRSMGNVSAGVMLGEVMDMVLGRAYPDLDGACAPEAAPEDDVSEFRAHSRVRV